MNTEVKLIRHCEASNKLLEKIANIKSVRWSYSLEQQLLWMKNNLQQNDVHLLVYAENDLIAYTNFVNVEVIINNVPIQFMGIGNVCTTESGKGYGDLLMLSINDSILQNNWRGILLCKDNLIPYYEKYQWNLISSSKILSDILSDINAMIYNFKTKIISLHYTDRNF